MNVPHQFNMGELSPNRLQSEREKTFLELNHRRKKCTSPSCRKIGLQSAGQFVDGSTVCKTCGLDIK